MPKTNEYKESLLSTQELPGLVYAGKEVDRFRSFLRMPHLVKAEKCRRDFYYFVEEFFEVVCQQEIVWNWHMKFLCSEMQEMAWRAIKKLPKKADMIINVPPGSTKSTICSVMFPAWVWSTYTTKSFKAGENSFIHKTVRGFSSSFICASYSSPISINLAQKCLDVISSEKYKLYFPELAIRAEKGARQSFQISRFDNTSNTWTNGGERFTTSVGGSATGMHGDFIIIDDPLNPKEAASDAGIKSANTWMTETIPTRKTSKEATPTVLIMQRLHQNDPTGFLLEKRPKTIYHIKLPSEAKDENDVKPKELFKFYKNGLLDPIRGSRFVLKNMMKDLGQYAFHAQFQQEPTPPAGGMFQVNKFVKVSSLDGLEIKQIIRYWDKAGTEGGDGAFTAGVKMAMLRDGRFIVLDVRRERFGADRREKMIREVALSDGRRVHIWFEQEGGSGGKESAEHSIRNLSGFVAKAESVSGDKIFRADPFSVQVNNGNVLILEASWNQEFIEEFRFFPYSRYKDQVDASAGAFNKLALKKRISII